MKSVHITCSCGSSWNWSWITVHVCIGTEYIQNMYSTEMRNFEAMNICIFQRISKHSFFHVSIFYMRSIYDGCVIARYHMQKMIFTIIRLYSSCTICHPFHAIIYILFTLWHRLINWRIRFILNFQIDMESAGLVAMVHAVSTMLG